jgi:hypothetical protein
MDYKFDIFGKSQIEKDKLKCGDYFLYNIVQDEWIKS